MVSSPDISFLIPTFNSDKTLERTLASIRRQSYPQREIEILIIDGGSTDQTIHMARRFNCKIFPNPKTDIMAAEVIGYSKAKGRYMVFLAPDEVLESRYSLKLKCKAIQGNSRIKAVLPTGYKTPEDYSSINYYINEFGDPFSLFMYRESKDYRYLAQELEKRYKKVIENKNQIVFSFSGSSKLPLIELWAGGCMVDLEYVKSNFPQIKNKPQLIPLLFYLLNEKGMLLAVTKNDPTVHYSSNSIIKYLKKIRSRVEYNVYLTPMGKGGYSGREQFGSLIQRLKKFLFVPYSFSLILPLIDSMYLTLSRRKMVYLLHLPLCLYTASLIIYFYSLSLFRIEHSIKLYGH